MKKHSESGFTLIEVMIGLTLMTVAALYFSDMIVNQSKQLKQATVKGDIQQLNMTMQQTISAPSTLLQSEGASRP